MSIDFITATKLVKELSKKPSDQQLLELYGLYKQGTVGDVNKGQPNIFDPRGRAMWGAWHSRKGMTTVAAQIAYVALVERLIAANNNNNKGSK